MNTLKFSKIVYCNLPLLKQGFSVQEVARILMLSYGDVKTKPSGLVSKDLVSHHKPTNTFFRKGKYTEEHFVTRTNTCRQICELYLSNELTEEKMIELLEDGRKVHFTTEDENMRLRVYQQDLNKYPTWEEQYKAAGIELVEDPGMFGNTSFYYIIHDTVYKDAQAAASALGCAASTIVNRCKANKPGYLKVKYEF